MRRITGAVMLQLVSQIMLVMLAGGSIAMCSQQKISRESPFVDVLREAENSTFDAATAERLSETLPALGERPTDGSTVAEDIEAYHNHYRVGAHAEHIQLGYVDSGEYRLAVQVFHPRSAETDGPVVLLVHGYLDHSMTNRVAIEELLEAGATVVTMDLPGHGLSSGPRGRVDTFASYGTAVHDTLTTLGERQVISSDRLTGIAGIGHSTGASALLEYGEQHGNSFSRLVLVAPLVRVFAFPIVEAGTPLIEAIIDDLPDRISGSTSNEAYIEFVENYEVLRGDRTYLEWVEVYLEWEEARREIEPRDTPLLLIQAGRDTVVDTDYNTQFLDQVYPDNNLIVYDDARHSIFTETDEIRPGLFPEVVRFLWGGDIRSASD